MATSDQWSGFQKQIKGITAQIARLKEERDGWIEEALAGGIDQESIDRWCDI